MIEPIKHYSFESIATVYDEDALTVLELCARLGVKINELIKFVNDQNDYIKKAIPGDIRNVVDQWLTDHPEATTTVMENSIDVDKLTESARHALVNNYLSPEMYGAAGDGETDDTAAIQAAIDAMSDTVGTVYLKAGQYKITQPIVIPGNVNLIGAGSAKYGRHNSDIPTTVIYNGSGYMESMVRYDRNGASVFGGSIRGITFDGCVKADYIIDMRKCGRVTIADNAIVNSVGVGIYMLNAYENIISGNWFSDHGEWAINLGSIANANIIENNAIALKSGSSGIWLHACNGNTVKGNTIEGGKNTSIGIKITGASNTSQNMITGNRIEFESHRYASETDGVCIQVGEKGSDLIPNRNYIYANAVFNQIIFESGGAAVLNHLNEFVDYGVGTVTDFYNTTNINMNPSMRVGDEGIVGFTANDPGFSYTESNTATTITLESPEYAFPLIYQLHDGRDYRGRSFAVSCCLNPLHRRVTVDIEFYRGGNTVNWDQKGEFIVAKRVSTFEIGKDQLIHTIATVPPDCDTIAVAINFVDPADYQKVQVRWLKAGDNVTWR